MNYNYSVKSKLDRGHDLQLIQQEENYIQELLSQMSSEEKADLDTQIWLTVDTKPLN